jgi:hypothetical protein
MEVRGKIAEFIATKEVIEIVRKNGGVEPAALSIEMSKANSWLASTKYYRKTIFKDFIPSDVEKLEPIK